MNMANIEAELRVLMFYVRLGGVYFPMSALMLFSGFAYRVFTILTFVMIVKIFMLIISTSTQVESFNQILSAWLPLQRDLSESEV